MMWSADKGADRNAAVSGYWLASGASLAAKSGGSVVKAREGGDAFGSVRQPDAEGGRHGPLAKTLVGLACI
jgi:hypothetical protein